MVVRLENLFTSYVENLLMLLLITFDSKIKPGFVSIFEFCVSTICLGPQIELKVWLLVWRVSFPISL